MVYEIFEVVFLELGVQSKEVFFIILFDVNG